MVVGVALVFSEQRALFAPGFFVLSGADAGLVAVRPSYLSELFPTEVRATLASFVLAVIVAAGSVGLVIVGVLEGVWSTRAVIAALAVVMLAGLAALRGLPETAGADVIGTSAT
jgi:hypothetical protein